MALILSTRSINQSDLVQIQLRGTILLGNSLPPGKFLSEIPSKCGKDWIKSGPTTREKLF